MNPVLGSIIENLRSIEIIYEPTVPVFNEDKSPTGDSKEYSVKEFIQSYLTNEYRVLKGIIFALQGKSANIDNVVLAPNHPRLITPKRQLILAEGVFCAVEVKPDITSLGKKSEFERALKQMKSVKSLNREIKRPNLEILGKPRKPAYFDKIPAIIFSNKSADFMKIIVHLSNKVNSGELKGDELPDLIFSVEKGVLFYCPHFKFTHYYNLLKEDQKPQFEQETFMYISSDEKHNNLLLFLILLLNFDQPYIPLDDFFIKKYLDLRDIELKFQFVPLRLNKLNSSITHET